MPAAEGVQAEEVAVAAVPGRWARTATATKPKVVAPFRGGRLALPQPAGQRVEVPRQPVRKRPHRRVGVLDDERQRARPGRRVAPRQRGRNVLAGAGVAARNLLAVRERLAAQRKLAHKHERSHPRHSTTGVRGHATGLIEPRQSPRSNCDPPGYPRPSQGGTPAAGTPRSRVRREAAVWTCVLLVVRRERLGLGHRRSRRRAKERTGLGTVLLWHVFGITPPLRDCARVCYDGTLSSTPW